MIFLSKSKRPYVATLLTLILSIWAAVYYTGDQDGKVAWSTSFTINTDDPDSLTQAISIAVSEVSNSFTIDTRDSDSVTLALAIQTTEDSTYFTIDTREPDSLVFDTSARVSETSDYFTIDTMVAGTTYVIWGDFTIDTRDSASLVFATSLQVSKSSAFFTIDTRKPPPDDNDADQLHDLWEILYFGSVLLYASDDDPDGDGLKNYYEFATGTDPTKSNAAAGVEFWVESTATGARMFLRYPRHILAARLVRIDVMMSGQMKQWIDETQRWEQYSEVVDGNGYLEWITLVYPVIGDPPKNCFVILKLSQWETDPGL